MNQRYSFSIEEKFFFITLPQFELKRFSRIFRRREMKSIQRLEEELFFITLPQFELERFSRIFLRWEKKSTHRFEDEMYFMTFTWVWIGALLLDFSQMKSAI